MNNIMIVGAGQLGSRHLQALCNLNNKNRIFVVDPSRDSLEEAKYRYDQVSNKSSPEVTYKIKMSDVFVSELSVVIIATNSAVRLQVIKELVKNFNIKYLILEKVLFQSTSQITEAKLILERKNIKAWVNCPRRQSEGYKKFAKICKSANNITMSVRGKNWGLGCNAIHFIDLWHFFTRFNNYRIIYDENCEIISSKRDGYKEISGGFNAVSENRKHKLFVQCDQVTDGVTNVEISINIDEVEYTLDEKNGRITKINELSAFQELKILFQSQLTHLTVTSLFEKGSCDLTSFDVSAMLHKEFLNSSRCLFTEENEIIPIT